MVAENKLIVISGTEFIGSQTASVSMLVAQSGTLWIPCQCRDDGTLITGSL